MFKTIEQCITYIENQIPQKIDLSLTRITHAASLIGNPQDMYKTIHITGTNGKGSTAAFTSQLLESQGLKVGMYTSPHLTFYNERIRINQQSISNSDFITMMERIIQQVLPYVSLTIFECLTLAGYLYFAEYNVDVAVIEVGLGGRYDATNIITPAVSCITNISVDHVAFLGDDIQQIAYEKSGIFKEKSINIHTVDNTELHSIIKSDYQSTYIKRFIHFQANETGFMIQFTFNDLKYNGLFPMYGIHQIRNLEAALAVVWNYFHLEKRPLKKNNLYEQIQNLNWRGRMEQLISGVYFDGAHNDAGIDALIQTIDTHFSTYSVGIVFSVMKDKDYVHMLQRLLSNPNIAHIYFLPLPQARALQSLPNDIVSSSKISEISTQIISAVLKEHQITLFAGSLYGYEIVRQLICKEGDSAYKHYS